MISHGSWAVRAPALLALLATGCSKPAAPSPEPSAAQAASAAAQPIAAPQAPPSTSYAARLESTAPCQAKSPCTATVVLEAKGEYHINDKYPYKFKPEDPSPGVQWAKPVFSREDGNFEEKRAMVPVSFTAGEPGDVKLAGVFSLSVCSAASCLMDRQPLETTVKVR